jgi:heat shock protein HslJ
METIKNGKTIFKKKEENEIVNKYWKLTILEGKKIEMAKNQEREQYFILKNDQTITGFAGCNHFNGQYQLQDGNRILFDKNLAVTMKACPDVAIDESGFLKVFNLADNFTIAEGKLSLNVGRRAPLAVFEAVDFN